MIPCWQSWSLVVILSVGSIGSWCTSVKSVPEEDRRISEPIKNRKVLSQLCRPPWPNASPANCDAYYSGYSDKSRSGMHMALANGSFRESTASDVT